MRINNLVSAFQQKQEFTKAAQCSPERREKRVGFALEQEDTRENEL